MFGLLRRGVEKPDAILDEMKSMFSVTVRDIYPDNEQVKEFVGQFVLSKYTNDEGDNLVIQYQDRQLPMATSKHILMLEQYGSVLPDEMVRYSQWRLAIKNFIDLLMPKSDKNIMDTRARTADIQN